MMDIATIVGLFMGIGLVLGSIMLGGGGLGPFINVPSIMITIGGSFAALLINFPLGAVVGVIGVVKNCFTQKLPSPSEVINEFKEFSGIARRDGLLALEERATDVADEFMSRGLGLVVGGTTKEELVTILETELSYIDERHRLGKKVIDALGAAAPAFGMVGTLIGLVQMLRTLDDPSQIGGGMATALLTTLYGAVIANLFCIPLAGKLDARNKEEMMIRELMIAGLSALVEGQTPRIVEGRLIAFLSPKFRPAEESQTAA
jgi:chemotaxis protein MotA